MFYNDTATTEISTLSLHDALPIYYDDVAAGERGVLFGARPPVRLVGQDDRVRPAPAPIGAASDERILRDKRRSEEHTSELQSRQYLVCRLLLEKKINPFFSPISTS